MILPIFKVSGKAYFKMFFNLNSPDVFSSLEKTLMLGGLGGRRRRGTTEDEMAGWHHQLNGYEFE